MDYSDPNSNIYPERQKVDDSRNFTYHGKDPHASQLPPKFYSPTNMYFTCRTLILSTLFTYVFLFPVGLIRYVVDFSRRTRATPELAEQFLMGYNVEYHQIVKDEHYWHALDIVTEWFRPTHPIHPVHFTDLRWYPWNLSTNAERPFTNDPKYAESIRIRSEQGDPTLVRQKRSFHNLYNEIFTYCRHYIHLIKDGVPVHLHAISIHAKPAIVFSFLKEKLRTVFGVPKPVIFAEAMFHWPLFSNYFTSGKSPLLWNYETLNGGWNRLNAEWYSRFRSFQPVFSLDWSEFDMHVYFDMWSDCRQRVKTYFCFCGQYCPTRTYPHPRTDPTRLHRLWEWIEHAYFHTPLVSPLGNVFTRFFAGMPSGIFCTQFYDSFYNSVMVVTILLALGYEIRPDHFFKCMGDDVLFGLLTNLPVYQWADFLEAFSAEAARRFNSKLSAKKCHVSQTIQNSQILGYFNWNGYPTRKLDDLLAALLNPKSLRDTPSTLMARSIGIYIASAGDKRFYTICKHIYDELQLQGYTPDPVGLKNIFGSWDVMNLDIDLTHFPTQTEAWFRLTRMSQRDPELQSRYWNMDHFLFEAGLAHH